MILQGGLTVVGPDFPSVQEVTHGIRDEQEREDRHRKGQARDDGEPWRDLQVQTGPLLNHSAPGWVWGWYAEAKEAQNRLRNKCRSEEPGRLGQDR